MNRILIIIASEPYLLDNVLDDLPLAHNTTASTHNNTSIEGKDEDRNNGA